MTIRVNPSGQPRCQCRTERSGQIATGRNPKPLHRQWAVRIRKDPGVAALGQAYHPICTAGAGHRSL
jgi:hypothetical protein